MDIIEQVKQMKLEEARREGRKEARTRLNLFFVTNMLTMTSHTTAEIEKLVRVSENYVKRVKASLGK